MSASRIALRHTGWGEINDWRKAGQNGIKKIKFRMIEKNSTDFEGGGGNISEVLREWERRNFDHLVVHKRRNSAKLRAEKHFRCGAKEPRSPQNIKSLLGGKRHHSQEIEM